MINPSDRTLIILDTLTHTSKESSPEDNILEAMEEVKNEPARTEEERIDKVHHFFQSYMEKQGKALEEIPKPENLQLSDRDAIDPNNAINSIRTRKLTQTQYQNRVLKELYVSAEHAIQKIAKNEDNKSECQNVARNFKISLQGTHNLKISD
jgi:hypothetical protein